MRRTEYDLILKKTKYPISEQECMTKYYSPIDNKQRVLNKWLKEPER
jgi:hypothetical protein